MSWQRKLRYVDQKINVLDKGYVRLVDTLGNDLSIANAARVSYDKQSNEMSEKDAKLIKFLWDEKHTSPFRHAAMTFEVYAPLFVARQWWKHAVSSTHLDDQNGWNESSRRYITENEEFYVPEYSQWRSKPANSKQGSGPVLDEDYGSGLTEKLKNYIADGVDMYNKAIHDGVAPEQARLFLPAYGMYVRWRWTVSLHGILNFLGQRLPQDAQYEIREYAEAIKELTKDAFPYTYSVALEQN